MRELGARDREQPRLLLGSRWSRGTARAARAPWRTSPTAGRRPARGRTRAARGSAARCRSRRRRTRRRPRRRLARGPKGSATTSGRVGAQGDARPFEPIRPSRTRHRVRLPVTDLVSRGSLIEPERAPVQLDERTLDGPTHTSRVPARGLLRCRLPAGGTRRRTGRLHRPRQLEPHRDHQHLGRRDAVHDQLRRYRHRGVPLARRPGQDHGDLGATTAPTGRCAGRRPRSPPTTPPTTTLFSGPVGTCFILRGRTAIGSGSMVNHDGRINR